MEIDKVLSYCPDTGNFSWSVPGRGRRGTVGYITSRGYRCIRHRGKNMLAHRIAWKLMTGNWPTNNIDHINNNKSDNRWKNLRDVSQRVNMKNTICNTNFVGVCWDKSRNLWYSSYFYRGKSINLGRYKTHLAACYARHAGELFYGD